MEQKQLINTHTYREWSCDQVSCVMVQWLYTGTEHAQRGIMGRNIWGVYICLGLSGLRNCWENSQSKQKRDSGWNWLYIIMTQWSGGVYILYECMLDTNKHCQWVNGWFCVPFDNMPQVISYNYDIEKAVTSGWYSF